MDDTGLPQISDELPELSALPTQDIPEAVRETAEPSNPSASKGRPWLWGIGGLGLMTLIAVPLILALRSQAPSPSDANGASRVGGQVTASTEPTSTRSTTASTDSASPGAEQTSEKPVILGHRAYIEAPAAELEPIPPDGKISLRQAAARKFIEMVDAAAEDGILIVPLSGFRSFEEQDSLFFKVKAERGEVTTKRAEVSAPPGYSEHHTGYAVDVGDGDHPGTDLQIDFEDTKAFKWLKENAAYYSFELSFPKDNPMGVSYEPWHWRFVGDRQSLETFYQEGVRPGAQSTSTDPTGEDTKVNTVK